MDTEKLINSDKIVSAKSIYHSPPLLSLPDHRGNADAVQGDFMWRFSHWDRSALYKTALTFAVFLVLIMIVGQSSAADSLTPPEIVPQWRIHTGRNSPQWLLLWQGARDAALKNDFDKAISSYQALLDSKSNLAAARWELVRIYIHQQKWDKALPLLELLVESSPARNDFIKAMAEIMWEKGSYDRAFTFFNKLFEIDPADQFSLARIIECLIKLGRRTEALALLDKLRLSADLPEDAKRFVAFLAFDTGKYKFAKPYLEELASGDSSDADVILRAAQAYDRLKKPTEALLYWKKLLDLQPDNTIALMRMVDFYEDAGNNELMLPPLMAILQNDPTDYKIIKKTGNILLSQGRYAEALALFLRFLDQYPADQQVLRSVVKIYADTNDRDNVIRFLEKYFAAVHPSSPSELHLEARVYDAAGRFREAIDIYKKLLSQSPDDTIILSALVNDLLAIGDNDRALVMWKRLGEVAADKPAVYRPMANLLEHLGRTRELIEILEIIYDLDSSKSATALKLADLYFIDNNPDRALYFYNRIDEAETPDLQHVLTRKGLILERKGEMRAALKNYERLLDLSPDQNEIVLRTIKIAGQLGFIDTVNRYIDASRAESDSDEIVFIKADLLADNGFFQEAVDELNKKLLLVEDMLRAPDAIKNEQFSQVRYRLLIKLSEVYINWQRYETAEQILRIALAGYPLEREHVLVMLAELSMLRKYNQAAIWLAALDDELKSVGVKRSTVSSWQFTLLESRLLEKNGERDDALKMSRMLFDRVQTDNDNDSAKVDTAQSSPRYMAGVFIADILIKQGDSRKAALVVNTLIDEGWRENRLYVLDERIRSSHMSDMEKRREGILAGRFSPARADLSVILDLCRLYKEFSDWQGVNIYARSALDKAPQSLKARLYLAESLSRTRQVDRALDQYRLVLEQYPANSMAVEKAIRLYYYTGKFEEAITLCQKILTKDPSRYDIIRLNAGLLWTNGNRDAALALYRDILTEKAEDSLERQLSQVEFIPGLAPVRTLWNTMTFSPARPPRLAEVVMGAAFAANPNSEFINITKRSAPLYSRYVWQEILAKEQQARESIRRGEYHEALHRLTSLSDTSNDPGLVFDLAYVYSRLGRLDDEIVLYEHMQEQTPCFPGLWEAVSRNRMNESPFLTVQLGLREDDGWDNYKAIRQTKVESALHYSPSRNHRVKVSGARILYESTVSDLTVDSRKFFALYSWRFNDSWKIFLGGGVESLDGENGDTALWSAELSGSIYDNLRGGFSYDRSPVTDTIASLSRNIVQQKTSLSLYTDIISRLTLGGEYGFVDYDDNNHMIQYEAMGLYTLFYEPTLLEFSIRYHVQDSERDAHVGPVQADLFAAADHPYWSPSYYWLNTFSLYFKHQLSNDSLDRGVGRYYTVKYSLGYDSRGYDLQALEGSFFWELNRHFILEASADIQSLKSFQSKKIQLKLTSRW